MQKLLFLLLFIPALCAGKDFQVKLHITNLPSDSKPTLLKIFNGNMYIVDSLPVNSNNTLTFNVPEDTYPGMFRAILGTSTYNRFMNGQPTIIDFLFNKEDIELSLDFNTPDNITVQKSNENKVYFDFTEKDGKFFQKLGSLEQVVTQYPDKDEFYQLALKYYKQFQIDREKMIDSMYNANRNMLAAKIINTRRMPFTEGNIAPEDRDSIFKEQFLDKIEFTDSTLLYTNIYTDKLFQYINFFIKRELGPRENEASIILAVDNIMPKISADEEIKNYLLQFLINGFESMKMEEVLAHISNNYLQQCGSSMELVKRRLEGYKKMAVGEKVPDLVALDINNNPVSLYNSVNPYTLLVFWHTECGHCKTLMAELPRMIKNGLFQQHDVKILAVSIDEDRENWVKFSEEHKPEWINTYIEGGFSSEAATNFNLFATPSMFLLNSDNTIIDKPITPEELEEGIKKLK